MNVSEIDNLIRGITKNEDAAQDVWLKILIEGITDIDLIERIASKRRAGTYDYLLRDFNNEGFRSNNHRSIFDISVSGKPYISKLSPRSTDVKCIYCGSSQVYQYLSQFSCELSSKTFVLFHMFQLNQKRV